MGVCCTTNIKVKHDIFSPLKKNPEFHFPHRIAQAAMSRYRCADGFLATEKTKEYFALRTDAALIITCATTVSEDSPMGKAFGLYTKE
jgi:2,4-dienoyl-CoA reductase-like NADH-dependent reductase (Old Yellow Enzyme family)